MDSEHRIADNPHRCRTLGCGGTEGSLNLVGTHDLQGLDLHATRSGQFPQIAHRSRVQRIGWCPQHRQSLHVGHGFSQELQLLRSEIETEGRESGDVTAGTGQAGGQAELDGIAHGYHDDRKRARRLMCSTSRGRPHRDDDLNPEADQVGDKPRKAVCLAVGPPVFDMDILSLDVALLTKAAAELLHEPSRRLRRVTREKADTTDAARRLGLDGERRGELRKSEADDENDREPDQPHAAREASRRSPFAPAPRPGLHRALVELPEEVLRCYAMARALRACASRATLPAGTCALNSTVN